MEKTVHGFWANHTYKRHSVLEIDEFIGWGKLQEICDAGDTPRNQGLPATLFETGCRISEGLQLRLSHFDLETEPDFVRMVNVPIVKQKKLKPYRTFSFPKDEPLWPTVEKWLNQVKRFKSAKNPDPKLFNIKRAQAWNIVTEQGRKAEVTIWNHWFRSQRASQIGTEYDFSESELSEWFKVIDKYWARRYCKKGEYGLRNIMIKRKPTEYRM